LPATSGSQKRKRQRHVAAGKKSGRGDLRPYVPSVERGNKIRPWAGGFGGHQ